MSYAIIRNAKYKASQVNNISRHNERKNERYGNKDIDKSKTELNYNFKEPHEVSYEKEFDRLRTENNLKGNLRLTGQKQSNIMCEFLITSDNEFFKGIGEEETKRFFQEAYNFGCRKCGEKNIISAVVHMDETTPHMHLTYIPVVKGLKKGEEVLKINASEFWKGFNSYGKLQDEFHDYVTKKGFNLDRGESKKDREHLAVEEFKIETKLQEIDKVKVELQKTSSKLQNKVDALKGDLSHISVFDDVKLDKIPLPFSKGKIAVSRDQYEENINIAKLGKLTLRENERLKREIDTLKENKENEIHKAVQRVTDEYERNLETKDKEIDSFRSENQHLKNDNAFYHSENTRLRTMSNKVVKENKGLTNRIKIGDRALDKTISLLNENAQDVFKKALKKAVEQEVKTLTKELTQDFDFER